jgi:chitinase
MSQPALRRLAATATVVAVVSGAAVVAAPAAAHPGYRRVGYYTQWSNYSGFLVRNVDTSGQAARLTHINYAFGNVNADGRCFEANVPGEGDAWADYQRPYPAAESVDGVADEPGQALAGNFNQLRKLKAKHRNLKVLISLGGWTWSKHFSRAVRTEESRRALVTSCVDLYLNNSTGSRGRPAGTTR